MAKSGEQDSETIAQILLHTIDCIAEQGYEGASMRVIAERASVAKSLLHYHFATKEELMLQAARFLADGIADDIARRAEEAATGTSGERLAGMAADLYELLLGDTKRCAFMTEMYATAAHNPRVGELLREYRQIEYRLIEERMLEALGDQIEKTQLGLAGFCTVVQTVMHGMVAQHNVLEDDGIRRAQWQRVVQAVVGNLMLPEMQTIDGASGG